MSIVGAINYLNPLQGIDSANVKQSETLSESQYADKSFKDLLNGAINEVNDSQIEEADLSLKLGLEVKNKAINAYREIMRMQI